MLRMHPAGADARPWLVLPCVALPGQLELELELSCVSQHVAAALVSSKMHIHCV
jgi:hypothetical protein